MTNVAIADLNMDVGDHGAGDPILLIHGWPDDASTWDKVAPALADAGRRAIVPTLRGFGNTHFTDPAAPRTANSGIIAMDMIALLDALRIERAAVVGWPDRVERIALLSTPPRLGGMPRPPFWHAQLEWYHWFMATARGAEAVRADPKGFAHIHWKNWSPHGWFDEATFNSVATSFENPDWVDITLHSYRSRWDVTPPDPRSAWLEDKIKQTETLSLPAIYIQGKADGVNPPEASKAVPTKFTGPFEFIEMPGVGHFPQREAPDAVARILTDFIAGERP